MRKMGLAAPILELVPKFVRGERLAILGNQERHIADFRRRECRVQRNVDVDRIAVLILGFLEADATAPDVLPAEPWRVFAPAARVSDNV